MKLRPSPPGGDIHQGRRLSIREETAVILHEPVPVFLDLVCRRAASLCSTHSSAGFAASAALIVPQNNPVINNIRISRRNTAKPFRSITPVTMSPTFSSREELQDRLDDDPDNRYSEHQYEHFSRQFYFGCDRFLSGISYDLGPHLRDIGNSDNFQNGL